MLLAYINYRDLNIGFLSLYSIDEYAFHGSLINMYDGLTTLDIKKLFSFGFYSYGFGFFFVNLLAAAPFFATDNIEMTIYIPRIITSLYAVGSVWFVYKIARQYSTKYISILIALLILTMPGFYRNALWFHPDWMMTFFIVLAVYFFAKDNWDFKKYFWWASVSLGFALATKIQAITFIPFVFMYLFYDNFNYKTFEYLKLKIKLFFKSIAISISIFIVANPYLIHPTGLKAFISSFIENMKSNATNHGLDIKVTIGDKISHAIDFYYFNAFIFILFSFVALISVFSILKKDVEKSIIPLVGVYFIINILYMFLMVNKDWQHYYLSIFTLIPLVMIYITYRLEKYKYLIVCVIILLQVVTHISEYSYVFAKGYHSEKEISTLKQDEMSTILIKDLGQEIDNRSHILISTYQPFDFRSTGLSYKNIHVIYGPISKNMFNLESYLEKSNLKNPLNFKEKDFIILSKNDIYFDKEKLKTRVDKEGFRKAIKIIDNLNRGGDLGYEKFKDNEYFYIWRKKK